MSISSIYSGSNSGGTVAPSILSTTLDQNGHLVIIYANGARVDVGNVVGSQGTTGQPGERGFQGIKGDPGVQGIQGLEGKKGEQGIEGKMGMRGQPGLRGQQGILGTDGKDGKDGKKGDTGTFYIKDAGSYQEMIDNVLSLTEGDLFMITEWTPAQLASVTDATGMAIDPSRMYLSVKNDNSPDPIKWSKPFVFSGLTGIQGPPGIKGSTGDVGPIGIQGTTGPQGVNVVSAVLVSNITNGPLDYLKITLSDGSSVTTTNSVRGTRGITGDTGPAGLQGIQGAKGIKGDIGLTGEKGLTGPTGLQGDQGVVGPIGERGERFRIDQQDITPPAANISPVHGYSHLDNATGLLYIYSVITGKWTSSKWTGVTGAKGEKGIQGIVGITGPIGLKGEQGIQGLTGIKGDQGIQGAKGDQGVDGHPDVSGLLSDRGAYNSRSPGFKYYGTNTNKLYVRSGPSAISGADVATINASWKEYDYTKGDTGIQGIQGVKGDSFKINEVISSDIQPDVTTSSYIEEDYGYTVYNQFTGTLHFKTSVRGANPSAWNVIEFRGPEGKTGRSLTFAELTPEQIEQLRGAKGEKGFTGSVPVLLGDWNKGLPYEQGAIVTYNNVMYQAKQKVLPGLKPTEYLDYWTFFMMRIPAIPADANVVDYVVGDKSGKLDWIKINELREIGTVSDIHRRFKAEIRHTVEARDSANQLVQVIDNEITWDVPVSATVTKVTLSWSILERKTNSESINSVIITDPDGVVFNLAPSDFVSGDYTLNGQWKHKVGSNSLSFNIEIRTSLGAKQSLTRYVYFVNPINYVVNYHAGFLDVASIYDPALLTKLTSTMIPDYPVPDKVLLTKDVGKESTRQYAWIAVPVPADMQVPSTYMYQNFPMLLPMGLVEFENMTYEVYRSHNPTSANNLTVYKHK